MKFVTNETIAGLFFLALGAIAYDVFNDVRSLNVAYAKNEVRFAGYDGMTQQVQEIRIKLESIDARIKELLELEKKHGKDK